MNSKIKKFFLVLLFVCVIVVGFFAIKIVTSLPSPNQIAQSLKGFGKKPSQTSSATVTKNQDTVKSEVEPLSQPSESLNSTAPTNEKKSSEAIAKENEQIEKLLNEDPNELNVCQNLGNPSFTDEVKGKGENLKIDDLFSDERRGDPAIEAFRYPIKAIFQDELVAPLMKEIIDLQRAILT